MKDHRKKLPIGIENFETIIKDEYYYVDKTGLVADLLNVGGLVTLYTRLRRFGKSLNMSMLEAFFSPGSDKSIFDGLEQIEEKHCDEGPYDDGFDHILKYGIAFYKKRCRVMVREEEAHRVWL